VDLAMIVMDREKSLMSLNAAKNVRVRKFKKVKRNSQ
jgi:hypothetical protein